jgi:hypothetical protein
MSFIILWPCLDILQIVRIWIVPIYRLKESGLYIIIAGLFGSLDYKMHGWRVSCVYILKT